MADKATDKRDSRQLIGLLTYNPGGGSLFEAIYFRLPLVPWRDRRTVERLHRGCCRQVH